MDDDIDLDAIEKRASYNVRWGLGLDVQDFSNLVAKYREQVERIAALEAVIAEALDAFPDLSEEWPLEVKRHLILLLNQAPSDALEQAKADAWDEGWQARDDAGVRKMRLPPVERDNPHPAANVRAEGEEKDSAPQDVTLSPVSRSRRVLKGHIVRKGRGNRAEGEQS